MGFRNFSSDTSGHAGALASAAPHYKRIGAPFMNHDGHDILADFLDDHNDARADIVRKRLHEVGPGQNIPTIHALYMKAHVAAPRAGEAQALGILQMRRMAEARHSIAEQYHDDHLNGFHANRIAVSHADGGYTGVHRISHVGILDGPVYHVSTHLPSGPHYDTVMNHREFEKWRDTLEDAHKQQFMFDDEKNKPAPPADPNAQGRFQGGKPEATKLHRTNNRIVEDARTYHEQYGPSLGLSPFDPSPSTLTVDPELTQKVIKAYEDRKHDPGDPEVQAAYDAFKRETLQQFNHAVSRGLKVERWTKPGQPYANSKEMRDHVDAEHTIRYFPTAAPDGYTPAGHDHPLLEQAPGHPEGVCYNDLFRAVHEYFAHGMHGHEFGPKGEARAWHEHAKMYSPLARRALTNETFGQTQWYFHGPHKDKPVNQRPFPEQRTAVLPQELDPVKLGMFDRIKKWIGRGPAVRKPGDGIVHKVDNPVAAWAERTAVAHALRLLGAPDHMDHVGRYTEHVARFVTDNPEHPVVKKYVETASGAGTVAHAGPALVEAVKPLVGAVNLLLSSHGLDQRFQRPQNAPPVSPVSPVVHASSAEAPMELEPETDAPTEDRHAAVLRLHKAGADNDTIVKHLIDVHGAKDRATALRWRRASLQRALMLHEQAKGPVKLAKPKDDEALSPKHVQGMAGTQGRIVAPLAGTALAFHLRQIAQQHPELKMDVWHALTGRTGYDAYGAIGEGLQKAGSRFAEYHDWANLGKHLEHDQKIEAFVNKHLPQGYPVEGVDDHMRSFNHFRLAAKQFGGGTHKRTDEFWRRFEAAGTGMTRDEAVDAMHRVADRHLDQAYTKASGPKAAHPEYREVMGSV